MAKKLVKLDVDIEPEEIDFSKVKRRKHLSQKEKSEVRLTDYFDTDEKAIEIIAKRINSVGKVWINDRGVYLSDVAEYLMQDLSENEKDLMICVMSERLLAFGLATRAKKLIGDLVDDKYEDDDESECDCPVCQMERAMKEGRTKHPEKAGYTGQEVA